MDSLTEKESRLCETIKKQFENQGVLADIKCQLHARLVQMMRERGDVTQAKMEKIKDNASKTQLLNQLIMEYLQWHQLNYTAEMLAMETGTSCSSPNRVLLESTLGNTFRVKDVPILLEIVLGLFQKDIGGDQL